METILGDKVVNLTAAVSEKKAVNYLVDDNDLSSNYNHSILLLYLLKKE